MRDLADEARALRSLREGLACRIADGLRRFAELGVEHPRELIHLVLEKEQGLRIFFLCRRRLLRSPKPPRDGAEEDGYDDKEGDFHIDRFYADLEGLSKFATVEI